MRLENEAAEHPPSGVLARTGISRRSCRQQVLQGDGSPE